MKPKEIQKGEVFVEIRVDISRKEQHEWIRFRGKNQYFRKNCKILKLELFVLIFVNNLQILTIKCS